jgi:hypothetical protein
MLVLLMLSVSICFTDCKWPSLTAEKCCPNVIDTTHVHADLSQKKGDIVTCEHEAPVISTCYKTV